MRLGLGDEPVSTQTRSTASPSSASHSSSHITPAVSAPPASFSQFQLVLAVPFLLVLIWAGFFVYNLQQDQKQGLADRPYFSQYRPMKPSDLNPIFITQMEKRFGKPVEVKLEKNRRQIQLRVFHQGQLVYHRPALAADLDTEAILRAYHEKTEDTADSVSLNYRNGKPYVFIYSASDAGE